VAASLLDLGSVYLNLGNLTEARTKYNEALQIQIKVLCHDHIDVAKSARNLAVLAWNQEDWQQCVRWFEEEWRIKSKVFGQGHKEALSAQDWLEKSRQNLK